MKTSDFVKSFKKGQIGAALVLVALLVWWGVVGLDQKLAFSLVAGVGLGYTLTRSRFGFAGGIKRIYVRGEGSLAKALLVAFAVLTLVYGAAHWGAAVKGAVPAFVEAAKVEGAKIIPGTQNVYMANIGTAVGAFVFGIGMIIAGGCASGTLADFGEGEGHAVIAFPLFVLGTIPGHWLREVIDKSPVGKIGVRAYLPDYFGYVGAYAVTILGLLALYYAVKRYERKRKAEGTYRDPNGDYEEFEKELEDTVETKSTGWAIYHKLFVQRWNFVTGAMILSFVSAAYFAFTHKAWGVTSAFTRMAVWFLGLFGVQLPEAQFGKVYGEISKGILANGGVILDIGIVAGAFLCFLLAGRFKFSFKFNARNAFLFGFGGLLMGFGSRLAKGCNIGALYSSLTNFSLSGWIYMFFISLGAVAGLKWFKGGVSCLVPARHRNPEDFK